MKKTVPTEGRPSFDPIRVLVLDPSAERLARTAERLSTGAFLLTLRKDALGTSLEVARSQPDILLAQAMMPGLLGSQLATVLGTNRSTEGTAVVLMSDQRRQDGESLEQSPHVAAVIFHVLRRIRSVR